MTWTEGEEIARGATAVVRRGAPGTVVKVFDERIPPVVVELEATGTRLAMAAGLPVAALLTVDADGTPPSLTFEHVEGAALAYLLDTVGPAQVGRVLAELQHQVRQASAEGAIAAEEFLGFQIRQADMPEPLRAAALRDLARLTAHSARTLCHMDLHDANVLWTGAPVIIDWTNAMAAPPEADVARTRMLIDHERRFYSPHQAAELTAELDAFIDRTERLSPGMVGASRAWDRVIAAARLDERPPEAEREAILARFAR